MDIKKAKKMTGQMVVVRLPAGGYVLARLTAVEDGFAVMARHGRLPIESTDIEIACKLLEKATGELELFIIEYETQEGVSYVVYHESKSEMHSAAWRGLPDLPLTIRKATPADKKILGRLIKNHRMLFRDL